MKKEGFGDFFNSQEGKVNVVLLFSIVLIFVLSMFFAEAVTVRPVGPGNLTYNGTRNVNFTFNVSWDQSGDNYAAGVNCSVWTNASSQWGLSAVNRSQSNLSNWTTAGGLTSWINFTFSADGNYTWSIGCSATDVSGTLTFATFSNRTIWIDTVAPQVFSVTPTGNLIDNTQLNITSNETAVFYVNVTDNSTFNVWVILNSGASFDPTGKNETRNRTMTLDVTYAAANSRLYKLNMSTLLNFTSNFSSPGPHSVFFCANDSLARITCSNRTDFVVKGMNIREMERQFGAGDVQHPEMGYTFSGLDIRYGNGTDVPADTFMDPTTGNFTFNMNFTADSGGYVVGGRISSEQFGNASRTNFSYETSSTAQQQAGSRMKSNMTWVDIGAFIPSSVLYEFGIIQMRGTFGKVMFCNGTSTSTPNCFTISPCNATAISMFNHTSIIPANSACWLTSGSWGANAAETTLASGFTYIFVDHFSGGLGANDFGPPNVTFTSPAATEANHRINTSTVNQLINFTVDDTDSTGLNLTANNSINVTLTLGGSQVALFSYFDNSTTNLTCTTEDTVSRQNTTRITCNVTYAFSNGTYTINITGRDTSNNSNAMNVTTNYVYFTIDQIAPRFVYYNMTNSSALNATGDPNNEAIQLGNSSGISRAQGDANTGRIFAVANWTDNLTQPLRGLFQFYNTSKSAGQEWQTLNESPAIYLAFKNGSWTNFSFPIPRGHNNFEGRNVSFRIIANDTVGNVNSSSTVKNFTIQINDTTTPTVTINGTIIVNGTNTTNTRPLISWDVVEGNLLTEINVSVDGAVNNNDGCNKFDRFTTSAGPKNVESNRNGSFQIASNPACTLGNGTHFIEVRSVDTWSNLEVRFHNFTVQSGSVPALQFNLTNVNAAGTWSKTAINNTNITSSVGITLFGTNGVGASIDKIAYVSSCNSSSSTVVVNNNTVVYPFNESGCSSASANRTLTVTVNDTASNSNTTVLGFFVDNVGPSISIVSPTNGQTVTNTNTSLNFSVKDNDQAVSFYGYYLDGRDVINTLNISAAIGGAGVNTSDTRLINFTSGTHTIKFTTNDTLGNFGNSSVITFTQTGPINFATLGFNSTGANFGPSNTTLGLYNVNVSYVNLTNASGNTVDDTRSVADQTLNLLMALNATAGKLINATITFNASAANWDKYNFSVRQNNTAVMNGIRNNQSLRIIDFVTFNDSIDEFIQDSGYYGRVRFPLNASDIDIGTTVKVQWYETTSDLKSPRNVTICPAAFAPTIADNSNMPCWNNTDNRSITVFVSHFSHIVLANDTIAPTITVNVPISTQPAISFAPNITVSDDTKNCTYTYNASGAQSSEIGMALTEGATTSTCVNTTEITNLTNGTTAVNITFYVYDTSNNLNQTTLTFSVNDTTQQNISSITIGSISSSGATVTITANESVNMSINSTGSTSFTNPTPKSTFAKSQTISLSSLSASKTYNLTVITCDRAGNCLTNTTLGFTTSAAAEAAAEAAAAAAGGGGGAAAPSNVEASAGRQWDTLAAGTSAVLAINNEKIAVTGVVIDVKNTVSNPSITVESLSKNPLSASAAAKVYQYLQLTRGNIADLDASKITIKFKVPKSWLTSNGVADSDIVLWRYASSNWNKLETKFVSSDGSFANYEAVTPGFSTFAIGNKEAGTSAFAIIDMIRDFYAGTSKLTAFDIIDQIRSFYGG